MRAKRKRRKPVLLLDDETFFHELIVGFVEHSDELRPRYPRRWLDGLASGRLAMSRNR